MTLADVPSRPKRQTRRLARQAKRAARMQAASQIMPPEGVPLHLPIASLGTRFGAQVIDILITVAAAVAILLLLLNLEVVNVDTFFALVSLFFFLIRVPYYIVSELVWNGQTLGKKLLKLKVVSHDGGSLTTHALVLRNIMKEAEIFLPGTLLLTLEGANALTVWLTIGWVAIAILIPKTNAYRMRLGDMLAGTHVVQLPVPILLKDLTVDGATVSATQEPRFSFLPHHLDHYGSFELQTLEKVLRAQEGTPNKRWSRADQLSETVMPIIERIRNRIGYADVITRDDAIPFLRAFYNAQRAHLEQKQLFGDRRTDKHHASKNAGRNMTK